MIDKAVIPIAGVGTRLYPYTRVVPKAMLPLPHGERAVLPVVHWICAEAAAAGIERVLLIVSPSQRRLVRDYLSLAFDKRLPALPADLELLVQPTPSGFGEAVMLAEGFVSNEPFLVLLGDHVWIAADGASPCAAQVVAAHRKLGGVATIGMQPVGEDELPYVGVAGGDPLDGNVYRCRDFIEKPGTPAARNRLATPDLPDGQYLAHCGIYVFGPQIFDCLRALAALDRSVGGEIRLADAQSMLLERHKGEYYLYRIAGRAYDTGTPANYAKAFSAFADRLRP